MAELRDLEKALLAADRAASAGDERARADAELMASEIARRRAGDGIFKQFLYGFNEAALPKMAEGPFVGAAAVDAPERISRGAGTTLAHTFGFLAPQAYLAKTGALAAPIAADAGVARRVGKEVLDTFRKRPINVSAIEASAGAGAGAGMQVAEEVAPGSVAASTVGGLAGAVVPAAAQTYAAHAPVSFAAKRLWQMWRNPAVQEAQAKKKVYPHISRAIDTPEARAELLRTQDVSKRLGLGGQTDFTVAQKSNSTQLLRDQAALESSATGSSLDALAARKRGVLAKIGAAQDLLAPRAGATDEVAEASARRITDDVSAIRAKQDDIQARMASVASRIPQTDKAALGRGIRESLRASKQERKEDLGKVAKAAGLDENDVEFDFDGLASSVEKHLGDREFGPAAPKMVSRIRAYWAANKAPAEAPLIDLSAAPSAQVAAKDKFTLRDLQDIRSSVSDDISVVAGSAAPDRNKRLRELLALRNAVDSYIDDAAPIANPARPNLAKDWATFRQRWRDEYINVFEKGRVYRTLRSGTRDVYKTSDEMVADAFFSPTGVQQYLSAGGDPAALRAAALDKLNAVAIGPSGQLNVKRMQTWLRANERNLPGGVRAELADMTSAATALAGRQNSLFLREQKVNNSLLARALKRTGRDPDGFIVAAMKDPRLMRQAMAAAGGPEEMEGLRRAAWLQIFPDGQVSLPKIDDALKNNHRALSALFGEEHLKNIKLIRDGYEIEARTPFPSGAPERHQDLISRIGEQAGTGVPQVSSRVFAAVSGRTSFRFVITEMLGRFFMAQSAAAQERVFKEALVNPELGKALAQAMSGKPLWQAPEAKRRLGVWMWNLGIPHAQEEAE